ncbi:MAG: site-2 protease family protein, partial [Verrucomicrobia bacterium]|nr:site-2 protease family protein [Verrucomicrobiota bacterium]
MGYFPSLYPNLSIGTYWIMAIAGMLGLFVCILLHEMGHAIIARAYQLPISRIVLFIFGGVAEIKKEPSHPRAEFLVAIAGPIVTILIALLMYDLTMLGESSGWSPPVIGITDYLAKVNIALLLFNLVPAFPLDGGRVFRAILWWYKGNFGWATKVTSAFGVGFAIILMCLGFFLLLSGSFIGGMWLIIIGLFLEFAASSTRTKLYIDQEIQGQKVSKFM